jgi:hypothetical protein
MILLFGNKQIEEVSSPKRRSAFFNPNPSIEVAARLVSFEILSICDAVYSISGETIKSRHGINSVKKEVKYTL